MGACLRWLRTRRISLCAAVTIILVAVYYLISSELVLDQALTRSNVQQKRAASVQVMASSNRAPAKISNATIPLTDRYVERRIQEALKEEKGTGCNIPKLDPFALEVTRFDSSVPPIVCKGTDWVSCERNVCRVRESVLRDASGGVLCVYRDILLASDAEFSLGPPAEVLGGAAYTLVASDHAEVSCVDGDGNSKWEGVVIGYREVKLRGQPPPGSDDGAHNILILGFDSTSKNGFIRRMPRSYKVLQHEMGAVILNGYNIVGDGTPAALFPILTGRTELELPEVRRRVGSRAHLDDFPFLWHPLAAAGYRTAYFEDSPWIGTFQYRFTGFSHQPTDHYLRAFFTHYHRNLKRFAHGNGNYCVGDTPSHALMLNITRQFMKLDSPKKFIFTFIADITHDNFNMISNADERLVQWLHGLRDDGTLSDTTLVVMGDHGPRYANVRNTLQGKQEERLPLMALVVAKQWARERPEAMRRLRANVDVLTTPFDLHSTLLELAGLRAQRVPLAVPGADLPRSMSLFDEIPANRSCSEAGVEPHWCTCLKWENVPPSDEMYRRAGEAFLNYINELTSDERSKCVARTLKSIESVSQRTANPKLLAFRKNKDVDGYLGSFDARMNLEWRHYQIKVTVGPGEGIYEASMSYNTAAKKFRITNRDISRINAYNDEPSCVSATRPDLNMYCYCNVT